MIRDYVSRYMDLDKCDVIIDYEPICQHCGSYLEDIHKTDFKEGMVEEYSVCTGCKQILEGRIYRLQ
jgi:hypothetical protein